MRLVKLALISFVILFTIVTLIGLLFPSKVIVSRAVDINTSSDSIYVYTKDLFSWKLWVESLKDRQVEESFKTSIGNSKIVLSNSNKEKITGEWIEKNGDKQEMSLSVYESNNKCVVQWQFEQKIKWYPWERFSSMINDKVIGGMMEQNLAHLKAVVEKKN